MKKNTKITDWIQATAIIVTAFVAIVSIYQTFLILKQQRNEEVITSQAYVNMIGGKIIKVNICENKQLCVKTSYTIKNSGSTPAENIKFKSYTMIKGKIENESKWKGQTILGPGQIGEETDGIFRLDDLEQLSQKSGNSLIVEFRYQTYKGDWWSIINDLSIDRLVDLGGQEYYITVNKQKLEKIDPPDDIIF